MIYMLMQLKPEVIREILTFQSTFVVLVIILTSLAGLIAVKSREKTFIKLIGGFGAILIALHSNDSYVSIVSLFISGLIIASEKFMSLLIALLRNNDKFLSSNNFEKMLQHTETGTKKDIQAKNKAEIEEITQTEEDLKTEEENTIQESVIADDNGNPDNSLQLEPKDYNKEIPKLEKLVIHKFLSTLNNAKIIHSAKFSEVLFDAIALIEKQNSQILYFVEAKIFPRIVDENGGLNTDLAQKRLNNFVKEVVPKLIDEIEQKDTEWKHKYVLMMVLAFNTSKDLVRVKNKLRQLTSQVEVGLPKRFKIKFVLYNLPKLIKDQ